MRQHSIRKGKGMANTQTLEGNWNKIKGKLRQRWGQLSDYDLQDFHGDMDELVGIIQSKTGEGRQAVEEFLEEVSKNVSSATSVASDTIREYAQSAATSMQEKAKQASDQMRAGYINMERFVRDRPGQSLLVGFGFGLIIGVSLAALMRSR